jgi:exosortase C (VPDSG-CTERM-specific)
MNIPPYSTSAANPPAGGPAPKSRFLPFLIFVTLITALSSRFLIPLFIYCAGKQLDSYILLIPLITAYFLYLDHKRVPANRVSPSAWAFIPAAIGAAAVALDSHARQHLSQRDSLSLMTLAFVSFIAAGGFVHFGRQGMRALAFPFGFLLFLIPLPGAVVDTLETASKLASAEMAAIFFNLFDVPVLRNGTYFQLPGVTIRVAQECSGIHSSLILVIASLIACHLILRSYWRRAVLILFAIVIGVVRNGFRILVLGWLCVHVGPQILDTPIHHQGGPIFFLISLVPMALLLWAFCKAESKRLPRKTPGDNIGPGLAGSGLQSP